MKTVLTFLFAVYSGMSYAQVFWTEDFGSGCSQGNFAAAYTGTNGAWTVSGTGTNDADANTWFVSASEAGMGAGNCGDGCGMTPSLVNRTLHLSNVETVFTTADGGATYNAGGICALGICVTTNRRVESPAIDCSNKFNVSVAFNYMEYGDGAIDDGSLWYYDGTAWSLLQNLAKTPTACSPQGQWTAFTVILPSSADNNPNVKLGFNWTNNDDGVGTDPSFAVDDIEVSGLEPVCDVTMNVSDVTCFELCDGSIVATATGLAPVSFSWSNGATADTLMSLCPGVYDLTVTDALGCSASANALVVGPLPLIVSDTVLADADCDSCLNGIAQANVSGGTAPYAVEWSNGQSDMMIVYLNPGVYVSTVTDANGCTAIDSVEVANLTGVEKANDGVSFALFPNPTRDAFNVSFTVSSATNVELTIYDAVGKLCYSKTIGTAGVGPNVLSIDRETLSPGVYAVTLQTENNSAVKKICVLP